MKRMLVLNIAAVMLIARETDDSLSGKTFINHMQETSLSFRRDKTVSFRSRRIDRNDIYYTMLSDTTFVVKRKNDNSVFGTGEIGNNGRVFVTLDSDTLYNSVLVEQYTKNRKSI